MTEQCDCCQALGFEDENRSNKKNTRHYGKLCYNQGKANLDSIPSPPPEMSSLWTESGHEAQFFRDNMRAINAQLNFGSLQVINKTVLGTGPASFKVCGALNRRVGSIMAEQRSEEPRCIQTYFYDNHSQNVTRARIVTTGGTDNRTPESQAAHQRKHQQYLSIFGKLRRLLVETCNNRFIQAFKTIKEYIDERGKLLSSIFHLPGADTMFQ